MLAFEHVDPRRLGGPFVRDDDPAVDSIPEQRLEGRREIVGRLSAAENEDRIVPGEVVLGVFDAERLARDGTVAFDRASGMGGVDTGGETVQREFVGRRGGERVGILEHLRR